MTNDNDIVPETEAEQGRRLLELYRLMEELHATHDSTDAYLEKMDDSTAAIVLEFDAPTHDESDGDQ